ncbi:MAG: 4'-phosphopantetheinyl transferase superfamily protein, partial [Chloroflexi bacterium]|nr:4'-phosphopantetheinyl transferase superfamily protein [Chloroflexota bacterium]
SGDLHIWSAALDLPAEQRRQFWRLLAPDEQDRANRFRFERDKNHFTAARGLLRTLIGRYLDLSPGGLQFQYSEYGKPSLTSSSQIETFQFNVTHSQGVALYAFCWGSPVGVDVEKIRPLPDAKQIAARFFSASENERFQALSAEQQDEGFFNCWTRKEAFIKAVGEGLSYPLDQFDATLTPGEPARLRRIRGSWEEAARWSLYSFMPAPRFVGATAVPGRNWRLACWRWPPRKL